MDLVFLKHLHPLTKIMPDHSHVTELLDETHRKTQDLSEDSPIDNDVNCGELAWGPMPQWEQPPPLPQDK